MQASFGFLGYRRPFFSKHIRMRQSHFSLQLSFMAVKES
jgi:hypothetical protein